MNPADQPPLRRNSRADLDRLLREMIDRPDAQDALARQVDEQFGEDRAVLVLDMSGFSRTTQRRGIVAFLLMIHQMRLIAGPAIEAQQGIVVKAEADNLYCLLPDVAEAVAAAHDIIARLDAANLLIPEDRRLYASIGIGYGRILNIDGDDLFGDEVNLASKLGEDIAKQSEILLTEAAQGRLGSDLATRPDQVSISGLTLGFYRLA